MIQAGSVVKLTTRWSKPEERCLLYVVKELYEDIGRCKIMCLNGVSFLKSIEIVDLEMIVDIGLTVEKDIIPFSMQTI